MFLILNQLWGDLGGIEIDDDEVGARINRKGSEYLEWYGYLSDGIYQTQAEVDDSEVLLSTVVPGDIRYKDISGPDGVPDGIISSYDQVLLGGSLPRYIYGGNIQLGYKNFDMSVVIQGVGKRNVLLTPDMIQPLRDNWGNVPTIVEGNYWSVYNSDEENLKAKYPRLSNNNVSNNYVMSDFWLFNGGYLRLKNITLGYTLPEDITKKVGINGARVFGSVSDLFSIDNYPDGWDPEVASTGYPITTSFVFGVSVNL